MTISKITVFDRKDKKWRNVMEISFKRRTVELEPQPDDLLFDVLHTGRGDFIGGIIRRFEDIGEVKVE